MVHARAEVRHVENPQVLMPGIASEGPIGRAIFAMGLTQEQALVVNVAGKGLILIVGCGHQGVRRIFERAEEVFSEPVYGFIGGLHFPVTQSRMRAFGLPTQQLIGTGKYPSCDWALVQFKAAFRTTYRELKVGIPVAI